jgi:Tfp pilus assembly protein PilP
MKQFLILIALVFLSSCSQVENRSAMTSDDLLGTWIDTIAHNYHTNINGIVDTVLYNSAQYTFLSMEHLLLRMISH